MQTTPGWEMYRRIACVILTERVGCLTSLACKHIQSKGDKPEEHAEDRLAWLQ